MADDFFARLAQADIPPPPVEFDRQLHERVNRSLLWQHVAEFATGALPWAAWHMLRALGGFVILTVTGSFSRKKK